jgi:hypothetical protein
MTKRLATVMFVGLLLAGCGAATEDEGATVGSSEQALQHCTCPSGWDLVNGTCYPQDASCVEYGFGYSYAVDALIGLKDACVLSGHSCSGIYDSNCKQPLCSSGSFGSVAGKDYCTDSSISPTCYNDTCQDLAACTTGYRNWVTSSIVATQLCGAVTCYGSTSSCNTGHTALVGLCSNVPNANLGTYCAQHGTDQDGEVYWSSCGF